jgi:type I restriction enzyme M protein
MTYFFSNSLSTSWKCKRQNQLTKDRIDKFLDTYQFRQEEDRYSKRIGMERIAEEDYNLNISRYISTAVADEVVCLKEVNAKLIDAEKEIKAVNDKHNDFLRALGLPALP